MFPSSVDGVIYVGVIDENGKILKNSTAHNLTAINAPGKDIVGLDLNNNSIYSSGTSQATALIIGYLVLLLDVSKKNNKAISNDKLIE
ncbi:S8 family serine peptidase [Clostridium perfringens]